MSNPDTTTEPTSTTVCRACGRPAPCPSALPCMIDGEPAGTIELPAPLVLRYDRLPDGTLVATASHDGRSVAAIVHARTPGDAVYDTRRWTLAGDVDQLDRPEGTESSASMACAHAAAAVERALGRRVTGYEVAR